ncbi:MAG: hypothetical protein ACFFEY_05820 [Candidatus Thorarchaeota archaeon]
MIRRKKEIKQIFYTAVFIIIICLSSLQILADFKGLQDDKINNIYNENLIGGLPQASIANINESFSGSGVNQNVRVYANNESENLLDNEEYFEIPSLSSEDMFLVSGDFNFTFQNNYTTEYVLEDDSALFAENFISFDYESSGSSDINYTYGNRLSGNFGSLTDETNTSYITMESTLQGVLGITIFADFTSTTYTSGVITGNVQFNRENILGFLSKIVFRVFTDANLTIQVQDSSLSTWIDIVSNHQINSSLGRQAITRRIINQNLNFVNMSNVCNIRFIFKSLDNSQFTARLNEYDMKAYYAFDLPITNQSYVALEFDLKGKISSVNGFYVWIRTLNLTEAATTELNITLYRSDITVIRTGSNLRNINLNPDYGKMLDSFIVSGYSEDSLSYFKFNVTNTGKLNLSNYFIVIKSNNPEKIYSLVTLPWFDYGDDKTEHQLKKTTNDGILWSNAKKVISTTNQPYTSGQLDASSFKLNVTRGYMPSDFIVDNEQTLKIQNIPIEDLEISAYPYNESSYLRWGIGRWNNNFSTPIEDDVTNVFRVDLMWNKIITKGFKFNVSFNVNAYWVENALSNYSVAYNNQPEWLFTYNFDKNNPVFNNWKFLEFWYVFYDYFTVNNVTNPVGNKILPSEVSQEILSENPSRNKIVIPINLATLSGDYVLNLTSHNFIHDMHSFINYNGVLWESNGFMNGDNMTIRVDVQDHNKNPPSGGDVNATLFYPDGSKFKEFNSSIGSIDDSILIYEFNNQTILEITNTLTIYGEYQLGFFWFNGSAVGCKKIMIYIDVYDVVLNDCDYYPIINKNILDGQVLNRVFQNYTMLVASINDTTGFSMPNFYAINDTSIYIPFSYRTGGQDLELLMTSFQQSENILNPSEEVNVKMRLHNLHPFLSMKIKIEVQIVSYTNEDWIIVENTSDNVKLYFSGHPNDSNEFDVNLTIPDLDEVTKIWPGVNAPIRLGGAKTIVKIYIDDIIHAGTFESPYYSLMSNKTSNNFDGYILGLKIGEEITTKSILFDFKRDKCIYFPDNSTFLVNIIDQNYVSSYKQFTGKFTLTLNSRFTNINIHPLKPLKGESFNISSILTTEFGDILTGRNVSCSYFNGDNWVFIGSDMTDSVGFTKFLIDTQTIDFEGDLMINLEWEGDSVNGISKNITVDIIQQINSLSISITKNDVQIYKGRETTFDILLRNAGDSNLRITNISINFNHNEYYSIVQIDYTKLEWFAAGDINLIILKVSVKDFYRIRFTVSITAQNIITNESLIVTKEVSYITYDLPIIDLIFENIMVLIIGIIALVFVVALLIAWRTKKKIETPIEEIIKKPRRGRYVAVSELKKPTTIKKPIKKKEEPKKIEEKEKTDLDSLLEERGLKETDKKTKE